LATFVAVRTVRFAVLVAVVTAPVAVRAADDAVRVGQRVDPLGKSLDVALRMHAQLAERARDAIFEHLFQLVPRSARHRLHLFCARLGGTRGCGCRVERRLLRPGFKCLALLHQCLEHLHPLGLRARKGAQSGEPDLPRRFEHRLRRVLDACLGRVRGFGFHLLEHRIFPSEWMRAAPDCARTLAMAILGVQV